MSEILITNWNDSLTVIGMLDGTVQYLDILDNNRTGNIYTGRVENKVDNLSSVFVRFEAGSGKHGIGFLPIKSMPAECVLNRKIENSSEIRTGDIVLVQIKTDEQKTKQARLTGKIKISEGDYKNDPESLIKVAKTRCEYQLLVDMTPSVSDIVNRAKCVLKSLNNEDIRIITDIDHIYTELSSNGTECIFYDEEKERISLAIHYSITSKTDDLLKKRVWLSSGGYLIIEQTETLNLIDINSGKNLKKSDAFFLELNKEAAREAYRQIRLRNLSGMILIDFISMKDKNMSEELIDFIHELIADDYCHMKYIDLTGLGIMEFTRDKYKKTLKETIDYMRK